MRHANALVFLTIHVAGAVLATRVLLEALELRLLLQLLIGRELLGSLGALSDRVGWGLTWVLVLAAGLTVLLAVFEAGRTIVRWARRRSEADVGLRLRVLLYAWVVCVVVSVLEFSTPESVAGPFRVRFPILAELFAVLVYGGVLLWLVGRRARARGERRALGRAMDVVFMNAAVALLLAELSLRALASVVPIPLLVTDESSSRIRRDSERMPPGHLHFGFPINEDGCYDAEFVPRSELGGPLVVSIGDSFAYGSVPHRYHFTTIAEREQLGLTIYNMGFPGTGPLDYVHLVDRALSWDPDLVVFQLFLGNDIVAGAPTAVTPRWYDADRYLLGILWHRLGLLWRTAGTGWVPSAERAVTSIEALEASYPWLVDPHLEQPSLGREVYLGVESRNARAICVDQPAIYAHFFRSLDTLAQAARGVPIAFVLIPDEFQVDDQLWEEIENGTEVVLVRDLPQRRAIEWLESRGYPYLDLLPVLRGVEPLEDGRPHLYHLQDMHFNARGNAAAGRALGAFLAAALATAPKAPDLPPLPFELVLADRASERWLGSGWQAREEELVWSEGLVSELMAPFGDASDIEMTLDCLPLVDPNGPDQRLGVAVNGREVDEIVLRPGRNAYRVTVPRELLRSRRNFIEFRYAYARRPREVLPGSEDSRELAVAWYSIRFSESGPGAGGSRVNPVD